MGLYLPAERKAEVTKADRLYIGIGVIFVTFQAVDAFMTWWAVNNGFYETNPIMRHLIESAGAWVLPLVKIIPSIAALIFIAWLLKKYRKLQPVGIALVACSAGLYVYIFIHNIIQIGG